jgi:2-methylcitrate dehydratase PrpD
LTTLVDHAIDFALETRWQDVPPHVQHQVKRCLLDTLGALLGGTQTPVGRLMADMAVRHYGGDGATILVDGRKVSAAGAALANGFAGNALDIDDGYRMVKGHPGACALPPVFAGAELAGTCSGERFLMALLVAYELGIRAGLIRHATYATYHSSGSWGAIAGAAAAGRLLALDRNQLFHALGCAEYHAPIAPMMKGIDTPSMGKDSIGWGCMAGVLSACMAREGFTGVRPLFDDSPDPAWVDNLGDSWEILNLYFKPYAACRWGQPAVAGVLSLMENHPLDPDQIETIHVKTFSAAVCLPNHPPKTTEDAQYNLAFPIAAAILDGEVGPDQVLPPRIFDKQLLRLLNRVSTEAAPQYDAVFPQKTLADVTIAMQDGRRLNSGPVGPLWEPPDRLPGDGELEQKFFWLARPVIGEDNAAAVVNLIWDFEHCTSIRPLLERCLPLP